MSQPGIPDDVARFIVDHIDSVEKLEVLLLLVRESLRSWTAQQVAKELRIASESAENRLNDLTQRGLLLTTDEGYIYTAEQSDDRAVRGLGRAYAERRVSVIQMIFSKPSDTIRSFADAFKLRKDKK